MWPSFAPVILMFLCSAVLLWIRPVGIAKWLLWLGVLLQVTVHTLTAFFWAPIQASMATPQGMSVLKYQQLMSTHWLRVSFFLAHAVLMIWMVTRSLSRERHMAA